MFVKTRSSSSQFLQPIAQALLLKPLTETLCYPGQLGLVGPALTCAKPICVTLPPLLLSLCHYFRACDGRDRI